MGCGGVINGVRQRKSWGSPGKGGARPPGEEEAQPRGAGGAQGRMHRLPLPGCARRPAGQSACSGRGGGSAGAGAGLVALRAGVSRLPRPARGAHGRGVLAANAAAPAAAAGGGGAGAGSGAGAEERLLRAAALGSSPMSRRRGAWRRRPPACARVRRRHKARAGCSILRGAGAAGAGGGCRGAGGPSRARQPPPAAPWPWQGGFPGELLAVPTQAAPHKLPGQRGDAAGA